MRDSLCDPMPHSLSRSLRHPHFLLSALLSPARHRTPHAVPLGRRSSPEAEEQARAPRAWRRRSTRGIGCRDSQTRKTVLGPGTTSPARGWNPPRAAATRRSPACPTGRRTRHRAPRRHRSRSAHSQRRDPLRIPPRGRSWRRCMLSRARWGLTPLRLPPPRPPSLLLHDPFLPCPPAPPPLLPIPWRSLFVPHPPLPPPRSPRTRHPTTCLPAIAPPPPHHRPASAPAAALSPPPQGYAAWWACPERTCWIVRSVYCPLWPASRAEAWAAVSILMSS